MTTTDDPTTQRLVKEIGLRTFADKYLDRDEEREVVRIAEQLGMDGVLASATITHVCHETGLIREAEVRDAIRTKLSQTVEKIDRGMFDSFVTSTMEFTHDVLSIREVQKLVVSQMEEARRTNVKRGWFSNWYADLKRELGVV